MSDVNAGQLGRKREHCHCAMPFFRQCLFVENQIFGLWCEYLLKNTFSIQLKVSQSNVGLALTKDRW